MFHSIVVSAIDHGFVIHNYYYLPYPHHHYHSLTTVTPNQYVNIASEPEVIAEAAVVALGYLHPSNFTMTLKILVSLVGKAQLAAPTPIRAIVTILATMVKMI